MIKGCLYRQPYFDVNKIVEYIILIGCGFYKYGKYGKK